MVFLNQILHAQVIRPFIGPSVGFSARVVWSKGWGSFGRKWVCFGQKTRVFWASIKTLLEVVCSGKSLGLGMHLGS